VSRLTDLEKNQLIRLIDLTKEQIEACKRDHKIRRHTVLELHLPNERRYYRAWFCTDCNRLVFARRTFLRPAPLPPDAPGAA